MRILGINDGHDSGICLMDGGKIIYASSEERFSRKKFHWGFPTLALQNMFEYTHIEPSSIERVAIGGLAKFETEDTYTFDVTAMTGLRRWGHYIGRSLGPFAETDIFASAVRMFGQFKRESTFTFADRLNKVGIDAPIDMYDHHLCHAASAYFTCGHDPALVITADGSGDGLAGSVYIGTKGHLRRIAFSPVIHSSGRFWDVITYLCGFKPVRHAGKITGLAAYKPSDKAYQLLKTLYGGDARHLYFRNKERRVWLGELERIRRLLVGFSREEIAYAAQKVLEEAYTTVIRQAIKLTGISHLALAGGTFANVRLNQIIAEMPEVASIWIFPHMGDGGLNAGAAYLSQATHQGLKPKQLEHVYLGPAYDTSHIDKALRDHSLPVRQVSDPGQVIADHLAEKHVIGIFQGRMEYGPRALGNRSIVAEPTDPTMMDWLNKRLERTEFMPFAPMILEHRAPEYFENFTPHAYPAKYMTLCFLVTDKGRAKAPGIVHKDGTARPQVVNATSNPLIARALTLYEEKTGLPLCINTSFNKHEEPIVCTPEDAIKEFIRGGTDVLVLEDRIVERSDIKN